MTTYCTKARLIAYIPNEKIDNAIPFIETIITKIMNQYGFIEHRFYPNKYQEIVWELDSQLTHKRSLSDHIKSLLDMMELNETPISHLIQEYSSIIACYYEQGYPNEGFFLSRETLLRLSKIPIDISFDSFE